MTLGPQFHHERLGKGSHRLTMSTPDHSNAAYVTFDNTKYDGDPYIEVDYLKSNVEGQGHARTLMEHLYNRYPKAHIDWGRTIHPASTHLAEDFENRYFDRTSYEPDDDGEDW